MDSAEFADDKFTIQTATLGNYVLSNEELNAAAEADPAEPNPETGVGSLAGMAAVAAVAAGAVGAGIAALAGIAGAKKEIINREDESFLKQINQRLMVLD